MDEIRVTNIQHYLSSKGIPWFMSGSRICGGYKEEKSDVDFVIQSGNIPLGFWDDLNNDYGEEFFWGGSHITTPFGVVESWKSVDDRINLILCSAEQEFHCMLTATKLCCAFGPIEPKDHRVAMFEGVRNEARKRQSEGEETPAVATGSAPF